MNYALYEGKQCFFIQYPTRCCIGATIVPFILILMTFPILFIAYFGFKLLYAIDCIQLIYIQEERWVGLRQMEANVYAYQELLLNVLYSIVINYMITLYCSYHLTNILHTWNANTDRVCRHFMPLPFTNVCVYSYLKFCTVQVLFLCTIIQLRMQLVI